MPWTWGAQLCLPGGNIQIIFIFVLEHISFNLIVVLLLFMALEREQYS